jgi:hypothetical protein
VPDLRPVDPSAGHHVHGAASSRGAVDAIPARRAAMLTPAAMAAVRQAGKTG